MIKRIIVFMVLLLFPAAVFSQSADAALEKYYSNTHNSKTVIKLQYLDSLQKIFPGDYRFTYEKSIALIQNEEYKEATHILDSLVASGVRSELVYCLWINCYMNADNRAKAKEAADSAYAAFPNSARVLCEVGYVEKDRGNEYAAVLDWESGIHEDPHYSENYIPLIDYNYSLNERIWSVIYGEIYLNISHIERNIERVSAKAFDAVFSSLAKPGDSIPMYRFCAIRKSYKPGVIDSAKYPFTFASQLEMIHSYTKLCAGNKFDKSLKSLVWLFDIFDSAWQKSIYAAKWKNPVWEYHAELKKSGLLEPYIYLMYRAGSPEEFAEYAKTNRQKLQKLAKYLIANPIKLTKDFQISKVNDY